MSEGPTPTPEPAPTPSPAPASDWRASLPAEMRDHPTIRDTKSVESLVKQHIDQASLIGRKGVIPPKDQSPEELNRFYTELGRPAKPDEYKFTFVDPKQSTPETLAFLDKLRPVFHEAGSTNDQVNTITKGYLELEAKAHQDRENANAEAAKLAVADLQSKWGMAFEARREMALRAGKHLFGDKLLEEFAEARLPDGKRVGDHPEFIKRLYDQLGSKMTEDQLTTGSAARVLDPSTARAEINKLQSDSEFMAVYLNPASPGHKIASDKMKALYEMEAAQPSGAV